MNEAIKEGDERRETPDSAKRDRRTVPRITDGDLRANGRVILRLCQFLVFFAFFYGAAQLFLRAPHGTLEFSRTLFVDLVLVMVIYPMFQFTRALRSWLATESIPKMSRLFEALRNLLIVAAVVSTILGLAHLVSLWN